MRMWIDITVETFEFTAAIQFAHEPRPGKLFKVAVDGGQTQIGHKVFQPGMEFVCGRMGGDRTQFIEDCFSLNGTFHFFSGCFFCK